MSEMGRPCAHRAPLSVCFPWTMAVHGIFFGGSYATHGEKNAEKSQCPMRSAW